MELRFCCVLAAALLVGGCGSSDESADNQEATSTPVLSAAEVTKLHEQAVKSYELFIAAPGAQIEAEFGKCRSDVLAELQPQHLNVMISDGAIKSVAKLKADAAETLKYYRQTPDALGEMVPASFKLCTFDTGFSERQVNTVTASCNFVNGHYKDHFVGSPTAVPKGLVYTCDGFGL